MDLFDLKIEILFIEARHSTKFLKQVELHQKPIGIFKRNTLIAFIMLVKKDVYKDQNNITVFVSSLVKLDDFVRE